MGMVACFTAISAGRVREFQADPQLVADYLNSEDESCGAHTLDVDKAWHGIHYLLNGDAWSGEEPLFWVVMGDQEIGEDVGNGPARLLLPQQVAEVAKALAGIDETQFRSRFAPAQMAKADVYPDIIWERDGQQALDYITDYYLKLVEHYRLAAARGDGMLAWFC